jgi:hypothetical protein
VIERAEAGGTSSSVTPPGAGLPKGGPTPCSRRRSGLIPRTSCVEAVAAARAAGSGVERSSGARIEGSVAEVGDEASSGRRRGEPKGASRGRRVGQSGGSFLGKGGACPRRSKGCWERRANVNNK